MNKGLFITLEGGEGAGKTSVAKLVCQRLIDDGYMCIITREPGGVKVAEEIRDTIMNYNVNAKTEALLFAAARSEHLHQKVLPAIAAKKIVICDRFIDSSIIYQGFAKNLGMDTIKKLNQWATDDIKPDLSILIDVPPEIGLSRINEGEREINRFDQNDLKFHQDIYDGYQQLFTNRDNRCIVDGKVSLAEVVQKVYELIKEQIG